MVTLKTHVKVTGTLTLDNGETVEVERIGKGRFSTAWRNCAHVYLQTKENDYGKEMYSHLSPNKHLPAIEYAGEFGHTYKLYKAPLYQPLTAKHKQAWADFKTLQGIWESAQIASRAKWNGPLAYRVLIVRQTFRDLTNDATYLSDDLKDAVNQLLDACENYGDTWTLEVVKKNSCVSESGDLILLDYIFDMQIIVDARTCQQTITRQYPTRKLRRDSE
jgi:hypothetical protein